MDVVVRGPVSEFRATLPLTLWPSGGSHRLEGADRRASVELDTLGEGEVLTAHVVDGETVEEDAAIVVTRTDGVVRLRRAGDETELVNRPGWGPMLAFAPWRVVVGDGDRVVETWPASSRHEADNTATLRAAEHARERSRWFPPVTCTVSETPRVPAAEIEPSPGPSPN